MDEVTKSLDLSAAMKLYGTLSNNTVEKSVAEQFAAEVKKAVARAQLLADGIINSLSGSKRMKALALGEVRKEPVFEETAADLEKATGQLKELAASVPAVVAHWRPFLDEVGALVGLDLSKVPARDMVPDSVKLRAQLEQASSDCLHMQHELELKADAMHEMQNRVQAAEHAVDQAAALLKNAQAALGEVAAENASLKKQLEAAKDPAAAYSRYNEQGPNPWKTYDDKPVPKWNELPERKNGDQVQAKWRAAVGAVITPPPPPATSGA